MQCRLPAAIVSRLYRPVSSALSALVSISGGHLHELIQDSKLHLKLDAVDKCLVCCLDSILIRIFEGEDTNIKYDNDHVDANQIVPDSP